MGNEVEFMEDQTHRWSIPRWSKLRGTSPRLYYYLLPEDRPVALRIGKRVQIIESPQEWERRMFEKYGGRVPTRRGAEQQVA